MQTQTPPPKEVIAPPMPGRGPMHKHTGFIIAIALTSLLLIGAAIMAYLSWDTGSKLAKQNVTLQSAALTLQQQNTDLQTSLDAEKERPGPVPFYYTRLAEPMVGPTEIHAVDALTGEDTMIANIDGAFLVITQPRIQWTDQILLHRITEGDNPSYVPYLFNVTDGNELTSAPLASVLPIGANSLSISANGLYALAVYDNAYDAARSIAFLNLITGEKTPVATLSEQRRYAESYSDLGGVGKFTTYWDSDDCVRILIWGPGANEGEVTQVDMPQYCISDFVK